MNQTNITVDQIEVFRELNRRLVKQATTTQQHYNLWRAAKETGQLEEVAALQDSAIKQWFLLEKIEDALQPFWDSGWPKEVYPRPDFYEEIREDESDPWGAWAKEARVPENRQSGITNGFQYTPGQAGKR